MKILHVPPQSIPKRKINFLLNVYPIVPNTATNQASKGPAFPKIDENAITFAKEQLIAYVSVPWFTTEAVYAPMFERKILNYSSHLPSPPKSTFIQKALTRKYNSTVRHVMSRLNPILDQTNFRTQEKIREKPKYEGNGTNDDNKKHAEIEEDRKNGAEILVLRSWGDRWQISVAAIKDSDENLGEQKEDAEAESVGLCFGMQFIDLIFKGGKSE